jgi:GAF domain-containing protein
MPSDSGSGNEEVRALLAASRAVVRFTGFETAARAIFDEAKKITGASAGYIALLSDDGAENEVLFLDAGGMDCSVDESLPMPIRGLRAEAYKRKQAVYDNDFANSQWMQFMPSGHCELRNVLFAPLIIDAKAVGLMGLANKNGDFTDDDARMAAGLAEFAAVSLRNSRNLDELRSTVDRLRQALDEVRTLKGIIPICACCKKVRDDEGFWEQVEVYVRNRSGADFSHGYCPECLDKLEHPPGGNRPGHAET